jgi:hypothetical protein
VTELVSDIDDLIRLLTGLKPLDVRGSDRAFSQFG